MKTLKKFLLIPVFAIVCTFARIDSARAVTVPGVTYPFSITTTSISANGAFQFKLSAQGTFYVDCGTNGTLSSDNSTANGMVSGGTINKTDTNLYTFKCTYSTAGTKTIQFGGTATAYYRSASRTTIGFNINNNASDANAALISSISGDLSAVFPYLGSGSGQQPIFNLTFRAATGITSIPATLFSSFTNGAGLFNGTFYECTGITSIPENLFNFGGNNVEGQQNMFSNTFYGCTGLTSIPANLFQRVTSAANGMFARTFEGCTGLTGYIPPSLFKGLIANGSPYSGSGSTGMMNLTFNNTGLLATSCPSGTAQYITGYEKYWGGHVSCAASVTCSSGKYLPANSATCNTCPSGKTCPGGTFAANSNLDQGIRVTVSYSCGVGTGNAPSNAFAVSGNTFTFATNTCTPPSGQAFMGWIENGNNDIKLAGKDYLWAYTENKTLTAVYSGFSVTTTYIAANGKFVFELGYTKGTYYVDCGEGGTSNGNPIEGLQYDRDSVITGSIYTCTYSTAGVKTLRFGGTTTEYGSSAPIAFGGVPTSMYTPTSVASISGDLTTVFPYLGPNQYPRFGDVFNGCTNLTSIPENLFSFGGNNVSGLSNMFYGTFSGCTGLTSIPANLFQRVTGVTSGAERMFQSTFSGCTGLTSIPENLFNFGGNNVSGQQNMFGSTFNGCTGLTSIPANLFQRVTSGADYLFSYTFSGCTGLTSIPENLFNFGGNNVSGQSYMFNGTFYGCSGLTSIPANLFQRVTSAANSMFRQTFYNCTGLTGYIPASTFAGLIANGSPYSGSGTTGTMYQTFYNTGSLRTSCPSGTTQYTTGYESYWNSHVACEELPPINLTWYDGNTTISGPTSCTIGGVFLPPTPPARTGYIFNGWKIKSVNP